MKVDVIERRGQAVVVEWMNGDCPCRAIVPHNEARGGKCASEVLERGIPYGDDFAAILAEAGLPTAEDIACSLHRFNIWSGDDLRRDIKVARLAILTAFGELLAALLRETNVKLKEARRNAAHRD